MIRQDFKHTVCYIPYSKCNFYKSCINVRHGLELQHNMNLLVVNACYLNKIMLRQLFSGIKFKSPEFKPNNNYNTIQEDNEQIMKNKKSITRKYEGIKTQLLRWMPSHLASLLFSD